MPDQVLPIADAADGVLRPPEFLFRLYVTGATSRSSRAISNARRIFERDLQGRYDLEIIDIYLEPVKAKEHQIVAAPTLVKLSPAPVRRVIGDLSDETKVRRVLGIETPSQGAVQ
jgi:circadian clock protein KaiB